MSNALSSNQSSNQHSNQPGNQSGNQLSNQHQLRLQIPQRLHQIPVLSQLVADYNLTVNIKAAILDQKATGGGWFDLVLEGTPENITEALTYLNNLGVEIWSSRTIDAVQDS